MDPSPPRNAFLRVLMVSIATLLAAAVFRTFVASVFVIPSQSMMPGLLVGDYFVASKWDYGWSRWSFPPGVPVSGRIAGSMPRIGDVVIFAGVSDPRRTYVKRVMGLPGDVVSMRAGVVSLNGRVLPQRRVDEFVLPLGPNVTCLAIPGLIDLRALTASGAPGCRFLRLVETLPNGRRHAVLDFAVARSDTFGPARVPEGHLFMMGDNRDDSLDSRVPLERGGLGMVPFDRLLGRARRIVVSTDGTGRVLAPWTWARALRPGRARPIR